MSDKPHNSLSRMEQKINRTYPSTDHDFTQFTITRKCGFELFNTRPYHNYEDWSCGYYAEDHYGNKVSAEDLDDCIFLLCSARELQKSGKQEDCARFARAPLNCKCFHYDCDKCNDYWLKNGPTGSKK